ncbi:energy transducer TonB [Sphingomonas canadensis]|uniref:Energy transducer TonB n=1 Tax=Sphingomonas canadensis TaxID=1219257 RepID=A0ABW3HGL4_9SPHN|nr:energy transducer TonB [Sphingomonas canadensis]MCW3838032.1 energy transducer TonB [Sphingomonas canadensis]
MAYADRNTSGSRIVAAVLVAVIIAGVGYAFVTGLAYQYIKKKVEKLDVFDVNEPPPPPEEPPPPPPDTPIPPPPVYNPPPIVQPAVVQQQPQIQTQTQVQTDSPKPQPVPTPQPAPPPAPPPKQAAKPATPRGQPGGWVTNDDYPPAARRAEQEGVTGFRLDVDAGGRVTNCTVTSSSGSAALDNAACSLLKRRAKFNPAEDTNGNKVPGSWSSRFRWQLER